MRPELSPPRKPLTIISGIPAGESGTGRLVAHLIHRLKDLGPDRFRLVARPERPALWQLALWYRDKRLLYAITQVLRYIGMIALFHLRLSLIRLQQERQLLLLHPQNLGFELTLSLLATRRKPPLLYLLDSSFFCIASYNHVKGDREPCTACISIGLDAINARGCLPFPKRSSKAVLYIQRLQLMVHSGQVKIAAQSDRQAALAQKQFNLPVPPPVVGLWAEDWDAIFSRSERQDLERTRVAEWDVVYHGHFLDAKGALWTIELATFCPQLSFLLPFARPSGLDAPANCHFKDVSWETGLQHELEQARIVLVPSLWSAPIEGALIKSIVVSRAVAVIDNSTSYCDELPNGLLLRLPSDPQQAARNLNEALENQWEPEPTLKRIWINDFKHYRIDFVHRLFSTVDVPDSQLR
jgi:hypothetical protein